MRLFFSLIFVAAIFSIPAWATVPNYIVVKDKSSLQFTATQNGSPVKGKFKDFIANIHFDAQQLAQSSVEVTVAMNSVQVTDADIMSYITLPEWLAVKSFPQAVFKSTKITAAVQPNHFQAAGLLTLRDKTVPAMLDFELTPLDAKTTSATGKVVLQRSDFGIGTGEWAKDDVIKNAVKVEFQITATQTP